MSVPDYAIFESEAIDMGNRLRRQIEAVMHGGKLWCDRIDTVIATAKSGAEVTISKHEQADGAPTYFATLFYNRKNIYRDHNNNYYGHEYYNRKYGVTHDSFEFVNSALAFTGASYLARLYQGAEKRCRTSFPALPPKPKSTVPVIRIAEPCHQSRRSRAACAAYLMQAGEGLLNNPEKLRPIVSQLSQLQKEQQCSPDQPHNPYYSCYALNRSLQRFSEAIQQRSQNQRAAE